MAEPKVVNTVSNRIVSRENSILAELSVIKSTSRLQELERPIIRPIKRNKGINTDLFFICIDYKSNIVGLY